MAELCLTLCDPMDCSTPGFPVLCYLLEFAQTHVHWVGDAIQPSTSLLSHSPPVLNFSQHQESVIFSSESVLHIRWPKYWHFSFMSVLPMNIQDWFPLGWAGWISLLSKELSRVFFDITVQKHQFISAELSLQSNSHIHTWLLEKPKLWLGGLLLAK